MAYWRVPTPPHQYKTSTPSTRTVEVPSRIEKKRRRETYIKQVHVDAPQLRDVQRTAGRADARVRPHDFCDVSHGLRSCERRRVARRVRGDPSPGVVGQRHQATQQLGPLLPYRRMAPSIRQ